MANVGVQAPPAPQYKPMPQEVAVQLEAQLALSLLQRLLGHVLVVAAVQFPDPLQTDCVVSFPAEQLAAVQAVELSG